MDVKFMTGDMSTIDQVDIEDGQILVATDQQYNSGAIYLDKNNQRYQLGTVMNKAIQFNHIANDGNPYPLVGIDYDNVGKIVAKHPNQNYPVITQFGFFSMTDILNNTVSYWLPEADVGENGEYTILTTRDINHWLSAEILADYLQGNKENEFYINFHTINNLSGFIIYYNMEENSEMMLQAICFLPNRTAYLYSPGGAPQGTVAFEDEFNSEGQLKWKITKSNNNLYIRKIIAFGGLGGN